MLCFFAGTSVIYAFNVNTVIATLATETVTASATSDCTDIVITWSPVGIALEYSVRLTEEGEIETVTVEGNAYKTTARKKELKIEVCKQYFRHCISCSLATIIIAILAVVIINSFVVTSN